MSTLCLHQKGGKRVQRRLPNGFGQISKIRKNLKRPWRAMVTLNRKEDGKYNRKIIGYFETYDEAYAAIEDYHRLTFSDLFSRYLRENISRIDSPRRLLTAYDNMKSLSEVKLKDITPEMIEDVLSQDVTPTVKENMRKLMDDLIAFAKERRWMNNAKK